MKPPTAVMLTSAFVSWDGRAQKVARSIADAGWDVWLIGRSELDRHEIFALGGAKVIELPAQIPIEGWRRRHLVEFETFDDVLDDLRPGLVHAHDVDTLGLGARIKRRAEEQGRAVKLIYDAHEYVAGVERLDATWRLAMLVEESNHIGLADGVITVIEPLAERLRQRYGLSELPVVVKNAPERNPPQLGGDDELSDIRSDCGLGADAELLVYVGSVSPARGLSTVVSALEKLEGVHFALQVGSRHRYVTALEQQASELGVHDRLHVLPYVASHRIVDYVRTATVGVIPLLHTPNHELALCNKYFEFMHARLPMVVSDVKMQAETTVRLGNGEVFSAGDVGSFVGASRTVLANRERYIEAYDTPGLLERNSWEAQLPALLELYARLAGWDRLTGWAPESSRASGTQGNERGQSGRVARPGRDVSRRKPSLAIGPSNMAGQAWAWAKAVERVSPEVRTRVYALERDTALLFPTDRVITQQQWWRSPTWHVWMLRNLVETHTHVLFEGGLALSGRWSGGGYFSEDAAACLDRGLRVGLIFHGSDIRNPRRFRELYPDLPFADPRSELTALIQRRYDALAPLLESFAGLCFVSTLDLLQFLPTGSWLPVTVDIDAFAPARDVMRRGKPVVLHIPLRDAIKGTSAVDLVARRMRDRGLIEYRRLAHVPPARMPDVIAAADIVLDQFAVGGYGVLATEAMAAGRVLVGHVVEPVRVRLGNALPIVEAQQHNLEAVLEELIEDRERCRQLAAQGREFVHHYHDGTYAAKVLASFLGVSTADDQARPAHA
jgi:glycosyltransferase involved in cell wall biosynthesis